ncbi:hypothetical protein BDR07DRAFT_388813 [Suillus spraguei]|nr:hypothetical protein BDR07DRAFT_388813 [Suillus spraguei]
MPAAQPLLSDRIVVCIVMPSREHHNVYYRQYHTSVFAAPKIYVWLRASLISILFGGVSLCACINEASMAFGRAHLIKWSPVNNHEKIVAVASSPTTMGIVSSDQ